MNIHAVPSVSLVMALYNQLPYTRQCLAALEACTPAPFELVLVDNGSTDGTTEFVRRLPYQVIFNDKNLGCAKAWNQGIRASKGSVVGILNNDIVLTKGWLERLLEFMARSGHAIVSPSAREGPLNYDLDSYANAFIACCSRATRSEIYGACFLVQREVFDRVGLFDEAFSYGGCEDTDFVWRARAAGFTAGLTGSVLIHHFVMVTQDAIKKNETHTFPKANMAHFEAKWKRTVRGGWLNRRWEDLRSSWQRRYERLRYGYTLVERS
jgi:N-acetylglucosaminyl-diphospho-decaprenol L-rhamnosyltransferase